VDGASKARAVREALDVTPTQAGVMLFGRKPKQAYDQWSQWENGTRNPSAPAIALFDLILALSVMRNSSNKSSALNDYIKIIKSN